MLAGHGGGLACPQLLQPRLAGRPLPAAGLVSQRGYDLRAGQDVQGGRKGPAGTCLVDGLVGAECRYGGLAGDFWVDT